MLAQFIGQECDQFRTGIFRQPAAAVNQHHDRQRSGRRSLRQPQLAVLVGAAVVLNLDVRRRTVGPVQHLPERERLRQRIGRHYEQAEHAERQNRQAKQENDGRHAARSGEGSPHYRSSPQEHKIGKPKCNIHGCPRPFLPGKPRGYWVYVFLRLLPMCAD